MRQGRSHEERCLEVRPMELLIGGDMTKATPLASQGMEPIDARLDLGIGEWPGSIYSLPGSFEGDTYAIYYRIGTVERKWSVRVTPGLSSAAARAQAIQKLPTLKSVQKTIRSFAVDPQRRSEPQKRPKTTKRVHFNLEPSFHGIPEDKNDPTTRPTIAAC